MSRENLKKARKERPTTQQEIADYLHICLRYYKKIESGEALGSVRLWDAMEDFFKIPQQELRYLEENIHRKEGNLLTRATASLS